MVQQHVPAVSGAVKPFTQGRRGMAVNTAVKPLMGIHHHFSQPQPGPFHYPQGRFLRIAILPLVSRRYGIALKSGQTEHTH
ncbi:MAG: hypothetical protein BWX80_04048 [Candidatus Hydrogenedentes bacterium ADurb.Bin101]|nr:MAG: hypothetical protein BWX80_04048 [Candidatus Hydrogenedentes bacterium ADurb.Bin101]